MPRAQDPELENRVVAASLRILDREGESGITLRAVAKEAGTTTPTIYERFRDRDELMQRLVSRATDEITGILAAKSSIEEMFREYLRYSCTHPMRVNLMITTFGQRYVLGEQMPAFDLLKTRISNQVGVHGSEREDLALAIASLAFGTAQGMLAAGKRTRHAAEFQRASLGALEIMLEAFSGRKRRAGSRGGKMKRQAPG